MMFVTIQYRLGGYGFLSPDAIEEESAPDAGLLDVRAATEWVQRNIRAFGALPRLRSGEVVQVVVRLPIN